MSWFVGLSEAPRRGSTLSYERVATDKGIVHSLTRKLPDLDAELPIQLCTARRGQRKLDCLVTTDQVKPVLLLGSVGDVDFPGRIANGPQIRLGLDEMAVLVVLTA